VNAGESLRSRDALGRRRYVVLAANALCRCCKDQDLLKQVSWESLTDLPHWCLLEEADLDRLRLVCGAVYMLPAIQRSIDAQFLKQVRDCLGEPLFSRLFSSKVKRLPTCHAPPPVDDIKQSIDESGAAILLGTLLDSRLRDVLTSRLGRPVRYVDAALAEPVYLLASEIDMEIATNEDESREDAEPRFIVGANLTRAQHDIAEETAELAAPLPHMVSRA